MSNHLRESSPGFRPVVSAIAGPIVREESQLRRVSDLNRKYRSGERAESYGRKTVQDDGDGSCTALESDFLMPVGVPRGSTATYQGPSIPIHEEKNLHVWLGFHNGTCKRRSELRRSE
eukprot:2670333-Rhodomonas_salina.1